MANVLLFERNPIVTDELVRELVRHGHTASWYSVEKERIIGPLQDIHDVDTVLVGDIKNVPGLAPPFELTMTFLTMKPQIHVGVIRSEFPQGNIHGDFCAPPWVYATDEAWFEQQIQRVSILDPYQAVNRETEKQIIIHGMVCEFPPHMWNRPSASSL